MKKVLYGIVLGCVALAGTAQGADVMNVALKVFGTRSWASSEYGEAYRADGAIDGLPQVKWNSALGKGEPFWWIVDLREPCEIQEIVIRHEAGGNVTSDFQLQRADAPEGPWTDLLAPIVGNKDALSRHAFAPVATRYVRLFITKAEQNGNNYARIFEVEVMGRREMSDDPLRKAFLYERMMNMGCLSDEQFEAAAKGLASDDVFVRALAYATIAQKVGQANNGATVEIGPDTDLPWVKAYAAVTHEEQVQFDYIRHAALEGKLFDKEALWKDFEMLYTRTKDLPDFDDGWDHTYYDHRTLIDILPEEEIRDIWLSFREDIARLLVYQSGIGDKILVYTRYGFHYKPNVCGTHVSWAYKPGGDILEVSLKDGSARPLLNGRLGPGHVHGMDVWYDGDRVVFAWAPQPVWPPPPEFETVWPKPQDSNACFAHDLRETMEPTHLYELDLKSGEITQLTDHNYWGDTEPVYLPSGAIVFSSDRGAHSPSCDSVNNDLSDLNLYELTADRKRIRRLLNHKDIDMHPRVLNNGQIAYLRWEYQERNFMEVHSVWVTKPDGSRVDALFKQHLAQPYGVRLAGSLGDSPRLLAVATGHHCLPQGPLVILNPAVGVNSPDGIEVVTQGMRINEGGVPGRPPAEGGRVEAGGFYTDPMAVTEKSFLASYGFDAPRAVRYTYEAADVDSNGYGVYLVDVYGNKELLFRDPWMGAYGAQVLRPRKKPPVLTDTTDRSLNHATCMIPNVYQGMDGVARGEIRHIRISEALPWPIVPGEGVKRWVEGWTNGDKNATRWCPVRVIGTVPVEADGSAHFKVPVTDSASVYFQALDENFMEVRRMRSSVSFAPGENRSCNGCHETRTMTDAEGRGTALMRPPSEPVPPAWGAKVPIHFDRDVQPVLTKHCARCHSGDEPKGGLDFTEGKAFRTIRDKKLVAITHCNMNGEITKPKQYGSHASPLIQAIRKQDPFMPEADWLALVTWVDANTPWTGAMFHRRTPDGRENVWGTYDWPDPWGYPKDTPAMGERITRK
ncbi:MAG: discoidin domain-containing protein [Kiritimatiellaeota bacterium]|nr:discoidin domain-containing protein [Kiritimatiellota bacterium]